MDSVLSVLVSLLACRLFVLTWSPRALSKWSRGHGRRAQRRSSRWMWEPKDTAEPGLITWVHFWVSASPAGKWMGLINELYKTETGSQT